MPIDEIVRNAVREIGYVNDDDVFMPIRSTIKTSSRARADSRRVNASDAEGKGTLSKARATGV